MPFSGNNALHKFLFYEKMFFVAFIFPFLTHPPHPITLHHELSQDPPYVTSRLTQTPL